MSLVQEELKRVDVEVTEAQVMALIDEGKDEGGREGQFWCLDPIDGTCVALPAAASSLAVC